MRCALTILTLLACTPAAAHDFSVTDVLVLFKADGTFQIDVRADLDALALGASPQADSAELAATLDALSVTDFELALERAGDTVLRRVHLRFDGDIVRPSISIPHLGAPLDAPGEPPTVLGTVARLEGRVPEGARDFTFGASRAFNAVRLTILDQATATGVKHTLGAGEDSPPFVLGEPAAATRPDGRLEVAGRYVKLGFEHILPKGLDHILFVLGLFLLGTRLRPLLWQVTAFTVAHSVTLALSMKGVVTLPARPVETLIAASIAYVAVENLLTDRLHPWRPALVFGFGLMHGLGFAGVLRELGMPAGEFTWALVGFNVGVELGQLAVVGGAWLLVGWARDRDWYRPAIVWPISGLIAIMGAYWTVERAWWGV